MNTYVAVGTLKLANTYKKVVTSFSLYPRDRIPRESQILYGRYGKKNTFTEKVAAPVQKAENTAVGIRHADGVAPLYPQKLALTSPTSGGRSRTQATEFVFSFVYTCRFLL
jgi:hypothetical protein